jgi:hypothetical protein
MQVQEHLAQLQAHQAQPTLVVVVAVVHTVPLITRPELAVQELALLGIGVRNGTLCKN